MNKTFWMSVMQEVIKTALVSMTGVTTIIVTNIIIGEIIEKSKNPMGFVFSKTLERREK